jgi:hypothetical protein
MSRPANVRDSMRNFLTLDGAGALTLDILTLEHPF